jgi:L-alanine-DL-glutamate epimerase-like enolase superfamily enzyme
MKKFKIKLGEEELELISSALELYARVGLLQFDKLTINTSFQKTVWDRNVGQEFYDESNRLKEVFGLSKTAHYSIFSEKVGDDCRIAFDIHQRISHKLNSERRDADICEIAEIKQPFFKINLDRK